MNPEEEQARLAKEEAEKDQRSKEETERKYQSESSSNSSSEKTYAPPSGKLGQAVADFALQFVGNPYVYGGTSLTNGADCSDRNERL